jgi:citronellol/citronellal dehydrogenase
MLEPAITSLKGKTIFISGSSRGIGKAIAMRCAQEGANIVITGKTSTEHKDLEGTIYSTAEEIEKNGGVALPIKLDIRNESEIQNAIDQTVSNFGGIDVLVNNASAINLSPTEKVTSKQYDLMHSVNTRGTFLCSQYAIPYLKKSENPHILNLSPPLSMEKEWFENHVAYTMAKYGMSMCVLGMASEFEKQIAVNALWPRTTIATAAIKNIIGGDQMIQVSRTPEIVADAAHHIIKSNFKDCSGNFFIDDLVLQSVDPNVDLIKYNFNKKLSPSMLMPDGFI